MEAPLGWIGKVLAGFGAILLVLGLLLWGVSRWGGGSGLPGDIVLRRGNWTVYVPLATCLVLSLVATLVLYLVSAARR
jgi:hypothetical protein